MRSSTAAFCAILCAMHAIVVTAADLDEVPYWGITANTFCSNRGAVGGSVHSVFIGATDSDLKCANWVASNAQCSGFFNVGGGWCECVPAGGTSCVTSPWPGYQTYSLLPVAYKPRNLNSLCSNRGGDQGKTAMSVAVAGNNAALECAKLVARNSACSLEYSMGGGWCDCVPKGAGRCVSVAAQGSTTYALASDCFLDYCNQFPDLKNAFCNGATCTTKAESQKCSDHWLSYGRNEPGRAWANPTTCETSGFAIAGCAKWACSCQTFSDLFGTTHGITWGSAEETARNWWMATGCSTAARVAPPPPVPPLPIVATFAKVADENGIANCIGTVRYGAIGRFVYKATKGAVPCTNDFFGVDPIGGVVKYCSCSFSLAEIVLSSPVSATGAAVAAIDQSFDTFVTVTGVNPWIRLAFDTLTTVYAVTVYKNPTDLVGVHQLWLGASAVSYDAPTNALCAQGSVDSQLSATRYATFSAQCIGSGQFIYLVLLAPATALTVREIDAFKLVHSFVKVSDENGVGSCVGTVRYGVNQRQVYQMASTDGSFVCSNGWMGTDPAPGVVKQCDCNPIKLEYIKSAPTSSYDGAVALCKQAGHQRLATSVEYCPFGVDSIPFNGPFQGDAWAPVSDSANEWIQIGVQIHKKCLLHSSLGGKPTWGLTATPGTNWLGPILCATEPAVPPQGYVLLAPGTPSCPPKQGLANQEECMKALAQLGLNSAVSWLGSHPEIPVGCSFRASDAAIHWNTATVGNGRGDLGPICKASR